MFFFFNDTATTEIYTLSLHDALPIFHPRTPTRRHHPLAACARHGRHGGKQRGGHSAAPGPGSLGPHLAVLLLWLARRSEEHTSELQSRQYLVCRLLLEKKKKKNQTRH